MLAIFRCVNSVFRYVNESCVDYLSTYCTFIFMQSTVSQLRTECADYIRSRSAEFLPYLIDTHTGEQLTEGNTTLPQKGSLPASILLYYVRYTGVTGLYLLAGKSREMYHFLHTVIIMKWRWRRSSNDRQGATLS